MTRFVSETISPEDSYMPHPETTEMQQLFLQEPIRGLTILAHTDALLLPFAGFDPRRVGGLGSFVRQFSGTAACGSRCTGWACELPTRMRFLRHTTDSSVAPRSSSSASAFPPTRTASAIVRDITGSASPSPEALARQPGGRPRVEKFCER